MGVEGTIGQYLINYTRDSISKVSEKLLQMRFIKVFSPIVETLVLLALHHILVVRILGRPGGTNSKNWRAVT